MTLHSETDPRTLETLTRLNQGYVDAFLNADVAWYRAHLADDFLCVESDGSLVGKAEFLRAAEAGPDVAAYVLKDVRVRVYGHVALVHATGAFTRRDGTLGTSRYTDVWVLEGGGWKTISAQITRAEGPPK